MHIKNADKIKELIKAKLPEYVKELGLKTENAHIQCPNKSAHDHEDTGKLSASFLPQSNNTNIYCFVENRTFDIFDIHSLVTGQNLTGEGFYQAVEELAKKYDIPLEYEDEFSPKEKEKKVKQKLLEDIHKLSISYNEQAQKEAIALYKQRNLNPEKVKHWKIGYLKPDSLTKETYDRFKTLFDYNLKSVFTSPSFVIPVFNLNRQYAGIILRQFGPEKETKYLNLFANGRTLFNIHNVRGNEKLTVVEGPIDCISLYPEPNVVGCLTNLIHDSDLEVLAHSKFKTIELALDPDNIYKGKARDGFLRSILKLKNLDTEIKVIEIPSVGDTKPDPDEYMRTHTLTDFHKLPRINALDYIIENYRRKLIPIDTLYDFIAGCPNLIRKEQMITETAKALNVGKRQLMKSVDTVSDKKDSFNLIQYAQEKDSLTDLLEGFTEMAWNQNYKGVPLGYPLFDHHMGGIEDTLYVLIGLPEMGKTSLLLNLVHKLASNPNNFVAFYSLDDGAKRSIVPRLFSILSGLTSKQIKSPTADIKDRWYQGLKNFESLKHNIVIKDGSAIRSLEDLDNYVKIHRCIAEEKQKKFIIVIDNLHDLNASGRRELEPTQNSQKIASYLKRLPQEINCPIISTAEVPKSASERPGGKDIKESIDFWYAARCVIGIFSNFHNFEKKGYSHLVWVTPDRRYQPIIELIISKNQTGDSWHGSLFYKFDLQNNTFIECRQDECDLLKKGQSII